MDDPKAWAKATRVADVLMYWHSKIVAAYEPRLAVQNVTRNVVLCDAPLERFSERTPVFTPRSPHEERWRPIDVLYGSYDPASRCIEIYINNIQRDATLFGECADVLQIVRLHEYANAVVHLGVRLDEAADILGVIGATGHTDWNTFIQDRTRAFEEVDAASHEYLAQAITLASLANVPDGYRPERLRNTFEALEHRQPPHYVVPDDIKASVHLVDWSTVVAAARRDIDVFRGTCSLLTGLWALAREFASGPEETSAIDREWVVALQDETAVVQLKDSLSAIERRNTSPANDTLELLVDRFAGLRIEVFANEHPPPHFRVICGGESANYRIADCAQLNGGLRRAYRVVRAWHAQNKARLIDVWNRHRPSDWPVGEYRET
jgi:hypothetical protein